MSETNESALSAMPPHLLLKLNNAIETLIDVIALQVENEIPTETADAMTDEWLEAILDTFTKAEEYNSPGELAAANETEAPELANNIRSLDIKDWTAYISFLAALITLILTISKVWDHPPPSPTVIQ